MPPDGLAVRVILWPLSIVGLAGVMEPGINIGLTVTRSVTENWLTCMKAESVTP